MYDATLRQLADAEKANKAYSHQLSALRSESVNNIESAIVMVKNHIYEGQDRRISDMYGL